ncbi:transcriptional regulator [Mycobacterium sp. NPDC050853]|uniref:helix-turn-helix domain-containing protein n=1 Tax=Mycobacterium sp. NPDC050853 TaxID=3155160 RepID=UPI0033DFFA46
MATTRTTARRAAARASLASVRNAHDLFVAGQVDGSYLASIPLPRLVTESWQRSLATGVDPDRGPGEAAAATCLSELRSSHPLAGALPVIRRLLVDHATDSGVLVGVTAADGALLWVEGDAGAGRKAATMNFVPGADWSERAVGTNAPGTALALDREVQIRGSEHFCRLVRPWSCTAVPIHDPLTGRPLGSIDLTGGSAVASAQTLALVRATAVAVEHFIALNYPRQGRPERGTEPRLTLLGADRPILYTGDGEHGTRAYRLSGRHAEIMALLLRHPEGLSADHLAMLLDENDLDVVTIRAEMSRLRRIVGDELIVSRPYRLLEHVGSDMGDAFAALRAGDIARAMDSYSGQLLPRSAAPAIARLRLELSTSLRGAVLADGELHLLRRWLDLPEARDDREGWQALHDHHGAGAIIRSEARGHLIALDSDLA